MAQLGYFITRWIAAGHAPVSNLFEFTTFFGMALVGAFIVIFFIYKTPLLGLIYFAGCHLNYCLCKYVSEGYFTVNSSLAK